MEFEPREGGDIDSWEEVLLVYNSALKEINTKLEILNDEFQRVHKYNPIEHIKARIKSPESIVKKLKKYGYESTVQNMVKYVNDIAGIRVICSFTSDIYQIAEMIAKQYDIKILSIKDYIETPKPSGYKSFHMLVTVPIFLSDRMIDAKVEIQIRTVAMDFWASLDHQMKYKKDVEDASEISDELKECAEVIAQTDLKMLALRRKIEDRESRENPLKFDKDLP